MQKRIATAALAMAVSGLAWFSQPVLFSQSAREAVPVAAPAKEADKEHAQIPVKQVVLYSSGVGYFEHLGHVRGSQGVHIDFTSVQLNDVLKSLTVLDLSGGRITGVDESIRIDVRQPSSAVPIGTYCCVTAGGDRQPWSARVSFRGATDPALTIVASTGGHIQGVERFAITGVRPLK